MPELDPVDWSLTDTRILARRIPRKRETNREYGLAFQLQKRYQVSNLECVEPRKRGNLVH
jgi:hypothetical protein